MAGLALIGLGRLRVTGPLDTSALKLMSRAAEGGPVAVDVSGVTEADQAAIILLARLSPEPCALLGCPSWLALAVERRRRELHTEGW